MDVSHTAIPWHSERVWHASFWVYRSAKYYNVSVKCNHLIPLARLVVVSVSWLVHDLSSLSCSIVNNQNASLARLLLAGN